MLVSENEVDGPAPDQVKKFGAVAIDTERVRERKRNGSSARVRDLRRLDERLFRRLRIPEIAFEVNELGGGNGIGIDIVGVQVLGRPEIGIQSALAVRSHQNVTATG